MQQFLIRRVGMALLALFALSIVTFLLVRHSQFEMLTIVYHEADYDALKPPNPVVHYAEYMKYVVRGDWGESWKWGTESRNVILERLPATFRLASLALTVSAVLGITFGILAAIRRDTLFDRLSKTIILFGQSLPVFCLSLVLLWIFTVFAGSLSSSDEGHIIPLILPAITLAWLPSVVLAKLTRSAMLSAMDSDYVKLARIKGLNEWKIIWKHCLRNVAVSYLISFGLIGGSFLTSLLLTETVFAWPGAGLLVFEALHATDHYVLNAQVLSLTGGFILFHLVIDVFRAYLDPRIRYSERTHIQYDV